MKRLFFLFFITAVTSCQYIEKKKIYSDDLLEEELKTINWNDVDEYPSFEVCDSLSERGERKSCFQNTLIEHVNRFLSEQNIAVSNDVADTIKLRLAIANSGELNVVSIEMNDETRLEIPEIDSLLHQSLSSVPKIFPAIKRGQQVNTEFVLPVIVQIN